MGFRGSSGISPSSDDVYTGDFRRGFTAPLGFGRWSALEDEFEGDG